MNKSLYIHHTINIVIMIILFILNFTNIGGTAPLVILAIIFVINTLMLIRVNKKKIEQNEVKKK